MNVENENFFQVWSGRPPANTAPVECDYLTERYKDLAVQYFLGKPKKSGDAILIDVGRPLKITSVEWITSTLSEWNIWYVLTVTVCK